MKNKTSTAWLLIATLFMVIGLFWGCKSPRNITTGIHLDEKKYLAADITKWSETQISEAISRAIQTAITERVNMSVEQKVYDTDKPADPVTGKPPLKEENNINLTKETDTHKNDSLNARKVLDNDSGLVDKTKDKGKILGTVKNEQTDVMPGWQKALICIVIVAVILLIMKYRK